MRSMLELDDESCTYVIPLPLYRLTPLHVVNVAPAMLWTRVGGSALAMTRYSVVLAARVTLPVRMGVPYSKLYERIYRAINDWKSLWTLTSEMRAIADTVPEFDVFTNLSSLRPMVALIGDALSLEGDD